MEVDISGRQYAVEYNARRLGRECVYVDGKLAVQVWSAFWFAPRFHFAIGDCYAVIDVRIWPWLTFRSFALRIDGELLYAEGASRGGVAVGSQDTWSAPTGK